MRVLWTSALLLGLAFGHEWATTQSLLERDARGTRPSAAASRRNPVPAFRAARALAPAAVAKDGCAALNASKPALTTACPSDCGSGSLCVFFPSSHASACAATLERQCVVGDTCAFQCIPNPAENAWFVSVHNDANVVDAVSAANMYWQSSLITGMDAVAVDVSLADSWVGPIRFPLTLTSLGITGNEAANNFQVDDTETKVNDHYQDMESLAKGSIVDFELPSTLFEDIQAYQWLRIENIKCPPVPSPPGGLAYPRMEEMSLRNTMLSSFPLANASFTKLATLDLSFNFMTDLSLSALPETLWLLNVSGNEIGRLTKDSLPKNLTMLDASYNGMDQVASGALPSQLQQFFLDHNSLATVPTDIASMRNLSMLWLSGNPLRDLNASALPPEGVDTLDVSNCSLTSIPKAFQAMTRMTELWLSDNDLSRDPDLSMLPASLKRLALVNCQLPRLPSSFQNLTNLELLSLERNPAAAVDLDAIPQSLREIYLAENELDAVPARIKDLDLQIMWLDLNPLRQLAPGSFPSTLVALAISNTTFEKLEEGTLPASLVQLQISNCLLDTAPIDLLAMQDITHLKIANCSLVSFASSNRTWGLQHLVLEQNRITHFDGMFPSLRSLLLQNNALESFSLSGEMVIEALYLQHNNLTSIPKSVFSMSKLLLLNLSNNPIRNLVLSADQRAFLTQIPTLVLDQDMLKTDCEDAAKSEFNGYVVCVVCASSGDASSQENPGRSSSESWKWLLPLGVGLALLVVGLTFLWRRSKLRKHQREDYAVIQETSVAEQIHKGHGFSIWIDSDLLRKRLNEDLVRRSRLIGSGMFGEVWLATYQGERVALKRLKPAAAADKPAIDDFVSEIKLLSTLMHPCVVRFVGVTWTKMSDIAMLTEYMDRGDLRSYLAKTPKIDSNWSSSQMVQVAISITEAIVYLHSRAPMVIHRDLKSRNVLLDSGMNAKLSDFGVSRHKLDDATMTAGVGTVRWVAPEVLLGQRYDESVDVYSLGVIFSEIDTHMLPFENKLNDGFHEPLTDSTIASLIVTGALKVNCSSSCPSKIQSLVRRCTSFEYLDRPAAQLVLDQLRRLLDDTLA